MSSLSNLQAGSEAERENRRVGVPAAVPAATAYHEFKP